jgi:hypothetical protein
VIRNQSCPDMSTKATWMAYTTHVEMDI